MYQENLSVLSFSLVKWMKCSDREIENPGEGQGHECYFGCAIFEMFLKLLRADVK